MTIEASIDVAEELGRRLRAFEPQAVVGIANGALLIAKVIADQLHLPLYTLSIRRRGSRIKRTFSGIPGLRGLISLLYRQPVLYAWIDAVMHGWDGLAKMDKDPPVLPVQGQVVALVDDCIRSGQTIERARQCLQAAAAKSVVTGCISWETDRDSLADYGVQPDVFLNRRVQSYPWSLDSPYWKQFVSWLRERRIELE